MDIDQGHQDQSDNGTHPLGPLGMRRRHRKARTGCTACKKRKIKCDETKPVCMNCRRRDLTCSLATTRPSDPLNSLHPTSSPSGAFHEGANSGLDVRDIELFHHFCGVTAATFATSNQDILKLWNTTIPRLAFQHTFLLHGLFAIAGMHKLHMDKDSSDAGWCRHKSDQHWDVALRLATTALRDISDDSVAPLYVFATLTYLYPFMNGPRSGDFILFKDSGSSDWLILFRSILSIETLYCLDDFMSRDSKLGLGLSQATCRLSHKPDVELHPEIRKALEDLEKVLDAEISDTNNQRAVYTEAFRSLRSCYAAVFRSEETTRESNSEAVFAWLHRVPEEIFGYLQEKNHLALALFSYYVVLIQQLDRVWVFKGWPLHLISGIYAVLPPQKRHWIQWPLERITSKSNKTHIQV